MIDFFERIKTKKHYMIVGFTTILALLIYQLVERTSFNTTRKALQTFTISVTLVILSITIIDLLFLIYLIQLKVVNYWHFNSKLKFKVKNFLYILLAISVMMIMQYIVALLSPHATSTNQASLNSLIDKTWLVKLFVGFVAPICEEFIYRGMFFNMIFTKENKMNFYLGIIWNGLLFGFLHDPTFTPYFSAYAFMGTILAYVYLKTKDIRSSMIVHMINNCVSMVI